MSDHEMPIKEAIAVGFALARKARDPRFRAYLAEITGREDETNFVIVDPDEPASRLLARIGARQVDMPAIIAMPDESQPFGYRMAVVTGPDVATVAGWRSTLAIYDDPELHAILTAPADEDELPDEVPVLAAAARRPRRFRRS